MKIQRRIANEMASYKILLPLLMVTKKTKSNLSRTKIQIWRRLGWLGQSWEDGLPSELKFWANALTDPVKHWVKSEYEFRINPSSPFQEELCELFDVQPNALRILDVGAGPLTALGKVWPGTKLDFIAVDPLADGYNEVLSRIGLNPPIKTQKGEGELLNKHFQEGEFDMAYSSNALDHCKNPFTAIKQMLYCVRQGGWVYFTNFANEGLAERYIGLHQWNFDVKEGDFIIDDGVKYFSVSADIKGIGKVFTGESEAFGKRVVICKFQKVTI